MQPGELVTIEDEDWERFDCPACRFAEKLESEAQGNGMLHGLLTAMYKLEEITTARNTGMSKLDIFRRLVTESDPDGVEIKNDPLFLPALMIMSDDEHTEVLPYCSVSHNIPLTTYYVSTEDSVDIWRCNQCDLEIRRNVSLRPIPLRPQA